MKHKLHFMVLFLIFVLLSCIIIPNFSIAKVEVGEADKILKQNLSSETMEQLVYWYGKEAVAAKSQEQKEKALEKICNEIIRRLALPTISPNDINEAYKVLGDSKFQQLPVTTISNIREIMFNTEAAGGANDYKEVKTWLARAFDGYIEGYDITFNIDPTERTDYYSPTEQNSTKLTNIGKKILAVINVVGVVVAVVALGIIGLRYMFGSVEERANYKETMVPYIIGLIMLGGITSIVNIIYNIALSI